MLTTLNDRSSRSAWERRQGRSAFRFWKVTQSITGCMPTRERGNDRPNERVHYFLTGKSCPHTRTVLTASLMASNTNFWRTAVFAGMVTSSGLPSPVRRLE